MIRIRTSEVNGTVKNSPELVKSVIDAAKRARVPYRLQADFLGTASDAGPFNWAGLTATTLLPLKMPQQGEMERINPDSHTVYLRDNNVKGKPFSEVKLWFDLLQ